jgi:hypothetical protein
VRSKCAHGEQPAPVAEELTRELTTKAVVKTLLGHVKMF